MRFITALILTVSTLTVSIRGLSQALQECVQTCETADSSNFACQAQDGNPLIQCIINASRFKTSLIEDCSSSFSVNEFVKVEFCLRSLEANVLCEECKEESLITLSELVNTMISSELLTPSCLPNFASRNPTAFTYKTPQSKFKSFSSYFSISLFLLDLTLLLSYYLVNNDSFDNSPLRLTGLDLDIDAQWFMMGIQSEISDVDCDDMREEKVEEVEIEVDAEVEEEMEVEVVEEVEYKNGTIEKPEGIEIPEEETHQLTPRSAQKLRSNLSQELSQIELINDRAQSLFVDWNQPHLDISIAISNLKEDCEEILRLEESLEEMKKQKLTAATWVHC